MQLQFSDLPAHNQTRASWIHVLDNYDNWVRVAVSGAMQFRAGKGPLASSSFTTDDLHMYASASPSTPDPQLSAERRLAADSSGSSSSLHLSLHESLVGKRN